MQSPRSLRKELSSRTHARTLPFPTITPSPAPLFQIRPSLIFLHPSVILSFHRLPYKLLPMPVWMSRMFWTSIDSGRRLVETGPQALQWG